MNHSIFTETSPSVTSSVSVSMSWLAHTADARRSHLIQSDAQAVAQWIAGCNCTASCQLVVTQAVLQAHPWPHKGPQHCTIEHRHPHSLGQVYVTLWWAVGNGRIHHPQALTDCDNAMPCGTLQQPAGPARSRSGTTSSSCHQQDLCHRCGTTMQGLTPPLVLAAGPDTPLCRA